MHLGSRAVTLNDLRLQVREQGGKGGSGQGVRVGEDEASACCVSLWWELGQQRVEGASRAFDPFVYFKPQGRTFLTHVIRGTVHLQGTSACILQLIVTTVLPVVWYLIVSGGAGRRRWRRRRSRKGDTEQEALGMCKPGADSTQGGIACGSSARWVCRRTRPWAASSVPTAHAARLRPAPPPVFTVSHTVLAAPDGPLRPFAVLQQGLAPYAGPHPHVVHHSLSSMPGGSGHRDKCGCGGRSGVQCRKC